MLPTSWREVRAPRHVHKMRKITIRPRRYKDEYDDDLFGDWSSSDRSVSSDKSVSPEKKCEPMVFPKEKEDSEVRKQWAVQNQFR